MPHKNRSNVVLYLVYLAVRTAVFLVGRMPVRCAYGIARVLGWFAYHFNKRHYKVAADNLRHAFPELAETEINRLILASAQHLFTMVFDTVFLMRKLNAGNVAELVRDQDQGDRQFVKDLLLSDRPAIVMTGHVGNWEVISRSLALQGKGSASIVARPLDNPFVDRYIREFRSSAGVQMIDKTGAGVEAGKVLSHGGKLGLVGDQDAGPKGIFVDFFGRPASTFKSIALLALEFQAPILVIGCVRTSAPLHHMLVLEDAIMPEEYMNDPGAVRAITQRYTSALERIVRRYPEQYFWFHRRWKNQPPLNKAKKAA